jgi:hypothetical protein
MLHGDAEDDMGLGRSLFRLDISKFSNPDAPHCRELSSGNPCRIVLGQSRGQHCSAVAGSLDQLVLQQQQHAVALPVPGPAGQLLLLIAVMATRPTVPRVTFPSAATDRGPPPGPRHSSLSHHRSPPEVGTTTGFGCGVPHTVRRLDPVLKGSTTSVFSTVNRLPELLFSSGQGFRIKGPGCV